MGKLVKKDPRLLSSHLQSIGEWVLRHCRSSPGLAGPLMEASVKPVGNRGFGRSTAVETITSAKFDKWVAASPAALLEFYAPWCRHCKEFAPTFESAARGAPRFSSRLENVAFGTVDGTANDELVNRYNVKSYPTIFFVH